MTTRRPPFLYPPGSPLMHPPLALQQSRMYGFWIAGDLDTLQASIDGTLNAAADGRMRFEVVTHCVLLTFTAVGRAYSTWPADRAKGWGRETDIVTWVMVARIDRGDRLPKAFYAFPLHIWVDDCMALINGRELFGYPKYDCAYTMPKAGEPAQVFRLAAKGFQPFSPETELAMHPLLDVERCGPATNGTSFDGIDAWRAEWLRRADADGDFWRADARWRDHFERDFAFPSLQQIFLKQFPDASGRHAVYQTVVAAPASVQAIREIELLGGDWCLDLRPFDSFPLDRSLGWKCGEQAANVGFRLDFDFEVGCGEVLVETGAG